MNLKKGYKQVLQIDKDEMQEYGEFFKSMRLSIGLTQKEIGKLIGVSNHTIYRWENGYKIPKMDIGLIEGKYREIVKKFKNKPVYTS